jgi:hypothetical protein
MFRRDFRYHPDANGPGAFGIHTGDVNGDGWPDITTVNPSAGQVNVLLNAKDGRFIPPKAYAAGIYPFGHDVGDVNADGRADVVIADFHANKVGVLLANPDGTLQPMLSFPSGPAPFYPLLGEFNGDGIVDFATPQYGNSTVGVYLGIGDGTFAPLTEYGVIKTDLRTMAVGDINKDGFTDVIAPTGYGSAGSLNVLRNDTLWAPPMPSPPPVVPHANSEAPKGRDIPAQGNALGWDAADDPALKGRDSLTIGGGMIVSPFQSFTHDRLPTPRALPWADMFRPFGPNGMMDNGMRF